MTKKLTLCAGSEIDKNVKKLKKPSLKALKKKCWDMFSLYIRTRDCLKTTGCASWGLCVTCGKRYNIKLLQAGHFIAGRSNAVLFSEKGTHAQCWNCNMTLHGNTLEYRRKIIELYGEGYDEILERESKATRKFTVWELEEMIQSYKQKILHLNEEGDE